MIRESTIAVSSYARYVALGDSSTEGVDDPDGRGGYRGWSQRLAERLAALRPDFAYANLAVRGLRARDIRRTQLAPALAMRPDLATVFAGSNDVLARDFDAEQLRHDLGHMQHALVSQGATVLSFTLPDLTPVMPFARGLAPRVAAMNEALRAASAASGAVLVDFAAFDVGSDRRVWSADRFHANAEGHARIAGALAHALGLPGSDATWSDPLPAQRPRPWLAHAAGEAGWMLRYLLPFAIMGLFGADPSRGRAPKRPVMAPFSAERSDRSGFRDR